MFDYPAGNDQKHLPVDIRIPDLKPWGLAFQGARKLVVEGNPAFQFFYATDNKALGPITVTVTNSSRADMAPTYGRSHDVNLLYCAISATAMPSSARPTRAICGAWPTTSPIS